MKQEIQTFLHGTNGTIAIYNNKAIVQQNNSTPKVINLDEIPDYIISLGIYATSGGHVQVKEHE